MTSVAVVIDAATKVAAVTLLDRSVDLPGPLDLSLVRNSGMSFGLGGALSPSVLVVVTAALSLWIVVASWRGYFGASLGPALVAGGAIANVADRVLGGSVIDMLDVGWWPTFNAADIFIVTGTFLLVRAGLGADDETSARRSVLT